MNTTITQSNRLLWSTPQLTKGKEHLQHAGQQLWRVLDARDAIRGHLRVVQDPRGIRYRAERLSPATRTFRIVGEFWNADDAVAALRY